MVLTRRQTAAAAVSPSKAASSSVSSDLPSGEASSAPNAADTSAPGNVPGAPKARKKSDFFQRLFSGIALTLIFFGVVRGGHICVGIAVILMEIGMFNEILRLGMNVARDKRIPLWRTTGWYFFFSVLFLFYGKAVLSHFEDQGLEFMKLPGFQYALKHHTFLAFCMYCGGFVGFVISLKQDLYRFQFTYFGRALVALLLVVVQSHFMVLNLAQGLIWFILPCWLIICNDSFGYFCGRLFGRHSLTALSPKKTWEGYIGAGIFTMIAAFFLAGQLSEYPSLICPRYDFDDCHLLCPPMQCDPVPSAFLPVDANIALIPGITGTFSVTIRPIQIHAIALGLFASSLAPFGGFFASGAKRAFGIKDFGGLLPGHGGVTDRVDCQLMMAVFTYVYVINFVKVSFSGSPDVGKLMSFVSELSTGEQIELLSEMYTRLKRRGVEDLLLSTFANLTNGTTVGTT